jgi:hypothetical protein
MLANADVRGGGFVPVAVRVVALIVILGAFPIRASVDWTAVRIRGAALMKPVSVQLSAESKELRFYRDYYDADSPSSVKESSSLGIESDYDAHDSFRSSRELKGMPSGWRSRRQQNRIRKGRYVKDSGDRQTEGFDDEHPL